MTTQNKMLFAIGLILVMALSRLFPVFPNFQPVTALALFAGAIFASNRKFAILIPISVMFLSDVLLHFFSESLLGYYAGFHYSTLIVYFAIVVIAFMGMVGIKTINFKNVTLTSLASALIFFLLTNMGSWLFGLDITNTPYEKSLAGFLYCFAEALPFFRYTLASTLLYSGIMFGVWIAAEKYVFSTKAELAKK
ncbi:MAG: hypothetical protein M9949_08575 [Candidatus Kapabacteria bacterium]|nr:hypothetical protein [Candidatus Kapabacteria bacterium]